MPLLSSRTYLHYGAKAASQVDILSGARLCCAVGGAISSRSRHSVEEGEGDEVRGCRYTTSYPSTDKRRLSYPATIIVVT